MLVWVSEQAIQHGEGRGPRGFTDFEEERLMIVSDMQNWDKEKAWFPSVLNRAVEYIQRTDFEALPAGRHPIDGDLMFALVQERETGPNAYLESHEAYVDLQLLLTGEEKIGFYRAVKPFEVTQNTVEENDLIFYRHDQPETEIVLQPGMFAVFFPDDLHRPCVNVGEGMPIKKVVVKMHVSLFAGHSAS